MHGGVFFVFCISNVHKTSDLLDLTCSQVVHSFPHSISPHCIQYPIFHQHYLHLVTVRRQQFHSESSVLRTSHWRCSLQQSLHSVAPFGSCLGRLGNPEGTMDKCMNSCVPLHGPSITSFSPFLVPRVHLSYLSFSLCLTGGVLCFDDVAPQVIESD